MENVLQRVATKVCLCHPFASSAFANDFYAICDLGFHSGCSLHFFLRGGRLSSAKSTERTCLRSSWDPGKDWPISSPDARSLLDNYKSQPSHLSPVGHFDQRVTNTFFAVMLCLLFHCLKDVLPQIPNLICPLSRCPNPEDPYTSELVPVGSDVSFPGHYRRFLFKMFAFVDNISVEPMHQQVTDGWIIAPNKWFAPPYWHVCLSYRCTFTAVHHCASLCQAASVNQTVSGRSKVSARFLKYGSKNWTKTIQYYDVCVFLCRERGNGHTEQSWAQCCGYCWTCDHVCPQAVEKKKKGFNSY